MRWIAKRRHVPCQAERDAGGLDVYDLDVMVLGPADSDQPLWHDDVTVKLYLDGEGADNDPDAWYDHAEVEVRLADLLDALGVQHALIPAFVRDAIEGAQDTQLGGRNPNGGAGPMDGWNGNMPYQVGDRVTLPDGTTRTVGEGAGTP